jgi:PAS domain S-box-containing protein
VDLSEYVFETLRTDGGVVLSRGRHRDPAASSTRSILQLATVSEHPPPATLKSLEHEHALARELRSAWAARPIALTEHQGRTTLVLEDPGGEPLDGLLGAPMEVGLFLRVAAGIASSLRELHAQGILHKDVKPANALVDTATGRTWLMGFGIASRLRRERQTPEPPEIIAGSLPYMSPEQTGRMNRSIDSRSDLYAAGVTLYEMLAGSLPFTASDPMEWVHCHIARRPVPPAERRKDVPGPVSAIVLKLLAKTPEDRYQTAAGLERDLRRCLGAWENHRRIDDFRLGEDDTPDRLLVPERLYGRSREVETLLAAFHRMVTSGKPELVLVSGYSGIGKSSVVNELHKVLLPSRGLFASGKFDQYKRDIPYATLAQAFQSLLRSLLGQSEAKLGRLRDALLEALGPNGQLIVDLVPELEVVIGTQPPVADLPPRDAKNRFQMVFRRFLGVFARQEHPLTLFLDDLQWLDAATLDLLESVFADAEVRNLLMVGAYRDNEVGPAHPLLRTLESIRNTDARVHGIVLAPLGLDDVGRVVADALHCEPERARPLARLVQEKTGGNPFFAIEFFTELAEEGLLTFDPAARAWQWNMDRIRAKNYTDNVVELISGKLKRFSATTQEALKQLACLGNVVEIATLTLIPRETEEPIDVALAEAVHAGVVSQHENAYKFLHDRIQQAAYSLIPEERRAEIHLRIGRALLASMKPDQLAEHLFDVANQLNRGSGRLIERDEKAQVATIDLHAGRKAKASAAYASARAYFVAGMALLDESDWGTHHELTFSLWLERTECEILSGNLEKADQLIVELLQRAASNVEFAHASCLKVDLHAVKGEYPQAVDSALICLRLFGIDLPAHPTPEQLQAEYETVWRILDGRPIESLIDLPPMRDPELLAVMQVLSFLVAPAYFTDRNLWCLQTCRMVSVSMQHGTSGASAYAYGLFGMILGRTFHRYREGYVLGRLACDLVEKYGFISSKAKVYSSMGLVAFWTQPIATAIDFMRACFRTAIETGDQTFACYGLFHFVTGLLLRNDPLDAVRCESEMALDFVRKTRYGDVADIIANQQRFIATMQGRSATFSTFSDPQFDEAAFEAQLVGDRMPMMICYYWIGKLKARFLSGDYAEALAAADKAKAMLWGAFDQLVMVDYHYYAALTVAALFENASADGQAGSRALLTAHQEQLREWAESCPPTFADKHALVSAEIARLEGRESDAMRLYEQAIHSARDRGFVQNEALAYEVAARFYAAHGFDDIAHLYLRRARHGYTRWGADGKVRQLDQLHPHLGTEQPAPDARRTIGLPIEHLDLATVVKVSEAASGEIVLERLIDTLLRTAVEHAGAERGLLVLARGDELSIEAEANTDGHSMTVQLREAPVAGSELPESVLHYAARTQESVILDDASAPGPFSRDAYIRERRARSLLCLPLVKQGRLVALLYLENSLAPNVFTPARTTILKVLASQAAMALENSRLYRELQERESKIRRLVDANIVGVLISNLDGQVVEANDAFLEMVGFTRDDLASGRIKWTELTPPEWQAASQRAVEQLRATGSADFFEKEYFRKDGSRVPVLITAAALAGTPAQTVAFVVDLRERKAAEGALLRAREELARVTRASAVGELAASIAHEINQPLAAVATYGGAALLWLRHDPPNIERARDALQRTIEESEHAGQIVSRVRAMVKKAPPRAAAVDINNVILEVLDLSRNELQRNGISLRTSLATDNPLVRGDRIQLQQVVLNLILNAVDAMSEPGTSPRELSIASGREEANQVLVEVRDSGRGLEAGTVDRIFDPFFTTKPDGMGMGLSISRSIVVAHGGRLWAMANEPRGAVFQFTLPVVTSLAG